MVVHEKENKYNAICLVCLITNLRDLCCCNFYGLPSLPSKACATQDHGVIKSVALIPNQISVFLFLRVRKKIKAFAKHTGCSENLLCLHLIFPVFYCNRYLQTLGIPSHMRTGPIKPPKITLCLNSTMSSLKHCPTKAGAHIKRGTNVAKARGCTGATEHRQGAAAELPPF